MTRFPHPSPRHEQEAFARAFLAALNDQLPRWLGRDGIEVKETHLVATGGDFTVEILFRSAKRPEAVYGFRWPGVCRAAAQDAAAAEAAGRETGDALTPNVTVALAGLDEVLHGSRNGLPRPAAGADVTWL